MERGNTKHSPHMDDQMERELRTQLKGSPVGTIVRERFQAEPPGEDQIDPNRMPYRDRGDEPSPTPEEATERAELGRWIKRTTLPADRDSLIAETADAGAPAAVVDELRRLPEGPRRYETMFDIWSALGHANESRF